MPLQHLYRLISVGFWNYILGRSHQKSIVCSQIDRQWDASPNRNANIVSKEWGGAPFADMQLVRILHIKTASQWIHKYVSRPRNGSPTRAPARLWFQRSFSRGQTKIGFSGKKCLHMDTWKWVFHVDTSHGPSVCAARFPMDTSVAIKTLLKLLLGANLRSQT